MEELRLELLESNIRALSFKDLSLQPAGQVFELGGPLGDPLL